MYRHLNEDIFAATNNGAFSVCIYAGALIKNYIQWQDKAIFDYSVDGGLTWNTARTFRVPNVSDIKPPNIKQSSVFKTFLD